MYINLKKTMLTTLMLIAVSAHSTDQKPLSDDQLNALYFSKVASLAVDKCDYKMNAALFEFIFDEFELTQNYSDPNGSYKDETKLINQQADKFMKNTSCEKLSELYGINGEALPGMLIVK